MVSWGDADSEVPISSEHSFVENMEANTLRVGNEARWLVEDYERLLSEKEGVTSNTRNSL
jgi:hypothetical protein